MLRKPPNETLFLPHKKCPFLRHCFAPPKLSKPWNCRPVMLFHDWCPAGINGARGDVDLSRPERALLIDVSHNIVQLWRNCSQLWSLKEGCNRRVRWMISHPWQIPWQTHGCGWQAWHWIWDYKIGFRLSGSFENWSWDARRAWKTLQTTFCRSISQCKMQTAKCKGRNKI